MKTKWMMIKKYMLWLLLLLAMDIFFCILLWIADTQAFYILSIIIVLSSLLFFLAILFVIIQHESKYQNAFKHYISAPTESNEEILIRLSSDSDKTVIRLLGNTLRQKKYENEQLLTRISDYEEYVESWAHETKTPISLLTLLLENHSEEIPENTSMKLDYIRNRMQEYVDQMLFYAKLKCEKKDYFLEEICLSECLDDILADYQPLLEEKNFLIHKESLVNNVFSDKRGLRFLLSQIISNSIKYTKKETMPELELRCETMENYDAFIIKDNGVGVKSCDLPYIFEKGFTGDSGENRKKATGIGLYLVKEIADDLNLRLDVESDWMQGFEIKILFPKV
ncbi:MAG: sensor histidine kinase [Lachnotalea sp.]